MKNPCTPTCPDRRAGTRTTPPCHADCPRRAAYLAERAEIRAARDRQRLLDGFAALGAAKRARVKTEIQRQRRDTRR